MPLYEYKCTACHKHVEKIQKFSDPEITICPHCGGTLERVLSAPAIAFKGGGWYADGYASAKPASAATGESSGGPASKPASDSGSSASTPAPAAPASAPAASSPAASAPSK